MSGSSQMTKGSEGTAFPVQWRCAMVLLILIPVVFLPYVLSIASLENPAHAPVYIDPSQPGYQGGLGGVMLALGKDLYIVNPRAYLNVFAIAAFAAAPVLWILTRKMAWLLFGAYMVGKYVLVLFNPFAHRFAFMVLGQHSKLLHFIDQDFVENFLVASLIVVVAGRVSGAIRCVQRMKDTKVVRVALALACVILIAALAVTRKSNADQLLRYSPYDLSFQKIVHQYLYRKNVTVLSDVATSRYIMSSLGNNIVGSLKEFNASNTEDNASRQLATETLMGAAPFEVFLKLLSENHVDDVYINNEVGLDNFFIANRLEKMSEVARDPRMVSRVISDGATILYATRWDLLNESMLPFFQQAAQMQIDKDLHDARTDLKGLLELLKLADAFSLQKDKIVLRILHNDPIEGLGSRLSKMDTIEAEMELIKHFRKNGQHVNAVMVYSDMLDTYRGYHEYPDRVYNFIHDIEGFPREIPALDLKDRYAITSSKVKQNRELINYLVNTYIQSELYERALEIGRQHQVVDPNYEYLNDRLREAARQLRPAT